MKQCAENYLTILDNVYVFDLKKSKERFSVRIKFEKRNFAHLLGVQYLGDVIKTTDYKPNYIFNQILKNKSFRKRIEGSVNFDSISGRMNTLKNIDEIIRTSKRIFKHPYNSNIKTAVKADYMLQFQNEAITSYLTLIDVGGHHVINSILYNDHRKLNDEHSTYKIERIYIEKRATPIKE